MKNTGAKLMIFSWCISAIAWILISVRDYIYDGNHYLLIVEALASLVSVINIVVSTVRYKNKNK